MEPMEPLRRFLKSEHWDEWEALETDQRRQVPPPPPQKACPPGATLVDLVAPDDLTLGEMPLREAIRRRRSRRKFTAEPLTLEELSFLLWATQGIAWVSEDGTRTTRTVPSAGSRHPFETYLAVYRVQGLAAGGLYRYQPLDHKLCLMRVDPELPAAVSEGCNRQEFVGEGAVTFIWTAIPYRSEWRYSIIAHKVIAVDAGHVCQNLYLAAEAIGAGTCAIGAYNQRKMDAVLGVDGEDEFVVYAAPVGKIG